MKKPNVVIAIAAYNEEANIKNLLETLVKQKEKSFKLKQILVVSDGSRDRTVEEARSVKDKRIKVVDGKSNLGKVSRLNKVFADFKEDVLVNYDADVLITDVFATEKLVRPFVVTDDLGVSFGNQKTVAPTTLIESFAVFGFEVWDEVKRNIGFKAKRFSSYGSNRAFSKAFLKEYRVPRVKGISEDSYSFYYTVQKNIKVAHVKNSVVYVRLASEFKDYVKQMSRYLTNPRILRDIFGDAMIDKYENIDKFTKLKAYIVTSFRYSPHISIGYFLLQFYTKIKRNSYKPELVYTSISSSKNLQNKSV